jgi:hypothetical protein
MARHTTPLLWAFLAALALVGTAARAEPREPTERHEHIDARHQHNHSYLDRGVVVTAVPRGAYSVRFSGGRYWFHGGVWYRAEGPRFIVIAPPVGILVDVLPPFFTTVTMGGVQYYYANDTYYVFNSSLRGFQVVDPPGGVDPNGATAPAPSPPPAAGGDGVFIYPKNGQSPEQQATDKYECHRWAAEQTGFDPTRDGGGVAPDQVARKRGDYARADGACLEGRGYTVR